MPYLAAAGGVALLTLMDALMKGASLATGAYTASLLRSAIGALLVGPLWLATRPAMPGRAVLRLHLERGVVSAGMALTWFFALTRLPLAEAIALTFVAPLLALYLARVMLGEQVGRRSVLGAVLGLAGVLAIVGGRIGSGTLEPRMLPGLAALAVSALLYAYNFVVIRRQSQVAGPLEVATFHGLVGALVQGLAAPWLFVVPPLAVLGTITISAALTSAGAMALAWAYARAQAQVLVPLEYTGFIWAALLGWVMFAEPVGLATLAGAVLIVAGCWLAAPRAGHSA